MTRLLTVISLSLFSLGLLALVAPSQAAVCGGAGTSVSTLTFADYSWNDTVNGYVYYIHPCSNVTQSACQGIETSLGGSMACQVAYSGTAYSLAVWNAATTQASTVWTRLGPREGGPGVTMSLTDGQGCGSSTGSPRSLTINYLCNETLAAGVATLVSVNETSTCNYLATMQTSQVCPPHTVSTCGTTGLDLTSITNTDLVWADSTRNYTYYFRPCGTVSSAQCANSPYGDADEAMMCQASGTNGEITPNTYDLAWWNPTVANWRRRQNGNWWQMTISDGTTCDAAAGVSRQLTVNFMCSATATTPVMTLVNETTTCYYVATVMTSLACNTTGIIATQSDCGGDYDLDFLSQQDLIYTPANSGLSYAFRPCGVVANAQCQSQNNTQSSMMCQIQQGSSTTYDLAIYIPSFVTYTPTLNGIQMYIQDGDFCATTGANRSLTVNFNCQVGPLGDQAKFLSLYEANTCQYVATVTTNRVCRVGRPNGYCGSANYDFSLAGNVDYQWTSANGQYTYYFQPCGAVYNSQCNSSTAAQGSMMCQAVQGSSTAYDIAFYDSNLVSWYKLANGGWQLFVQDGTSCGSSGYLRALTANFVCGTSPVFNNLTEVTTCNYVAYVTTPQACAAVSAGQSAGVMVSYTGSNAYSYETVSTCGGPYNLASLTTTDLSWTGGGYVWYLRPCGAVSNSNCTAAAAAAGQSVWMLCQDSLNSAGAYDASVYSPYQASYTPTRQGLIMQVADGALCGTLGSRVTNVYFMCNSSATTASIYNITESPTCTYNVFVYTNLTCPTTSTACGGAGYDLSALTTRGDLQQVNSTSGYTWYFSPCGVVQNSVCQANADTQDASMCQVATGSNSSYEVAVYAPQLTIWTALSNGVQMVVQDGETCNGYDFERVLTVNFLCGQGGGYQFISMYEATLCNYVAQINTGLACSQLQSSSSSSSLSGGAIAGIVIAVIVAVACLCLLVAFVYGRSGSKGQKGGKSSWNSADAAAQRSAGSFNDLEASQSAVEMETAPSDGTSSP